MTARPTPAEALHHDRAVRTAARLQGGDGGDADAVPGDVDERLRSRCAVDRHVRGAQPVARVVARLVEEDGPVGRG